MNIFKCDICGSETSVNPRTEAVLENGEPVMVDLETMNFVTGQVQVTKVPKMKDLSKRCHIVKLNAGYQSIQKDFCTDCLNTLMPEIKALWNKLKAIGSK